MAVKINCDSPVWKKKDQCKGENLYKKLVSAVGIITEDMSYYKAETTQLPFSQCDEIQDILSDDLNTPEALAKLNDIVNRLSKANTNDDKKLLKEQVIVMNHRY